MSQPLGDPGLCRGHAFYDFLRVDLQISPVKLLPAFALRCVLQCFVEVEAHFFIDVSANSATSFMVRVRFTVLLQIAVRQFCELDTSTFATCAFWLSCSFVTCKSHVVGEGRPSKTYRFFDVDVSQVMNSRELALPNVYQA